MVDGDWIKTALDRYEAPLIRYARHILGDLDQARDVVQETFLRLCRQDPKRLQSHLAPWLFKVCRNRALDVRRKTSQIAPLEDSQLAHLRSEGPGPSKRLETSETISEVLRLLGELPHNQQEVIRLKFQNGFSYREISEVTGLSVSNVGFLIHTALKTIRKRLASEDTPRRPAVRRIK